MDKTTKILLDYTSGKTPLGETNRALEDAGSDIRLNPAKNLFTPEELLATHTGETPEEAEGYGLLDTGTGSMEKVHVTAVVLYSAVNEVLPDGGTNMTAYVLIGGQRYEVKGAALTAC